MELLAIVQPSWIPLGQFKKTHDNKETCVLKYINIYMYIYIFIPIFFSKRKKLKLSNKL